MRPRRGYESQPGLPPRHLSPQARAAGDCTPLYDHMCNKTLTSVVHRYPQASRRLEVACRPTEGREQYCTRSGRGGRAVGSHLNHRGVFTTDIATRTLEDGHRRRRWTSRRLDHQPQTSLRLRAGAVVWGRQSFTRLGFLHFATRRETHLSISWRIWSIVNLGILLPCSSCDTPDREEKEPRANLVPKKEDVVSARVHIKGAAEGTGRERALAATPDREFVCPSVFGSRSVGGEFPSLSFSPCAPVCFRKWTCGAPFSAMSAMMTTVRSSLPLPSGRVQQRGVPPPAGPGSGRRVSHVIRAVASDGGRMKVSAFERVSILSESLPYLQKFRGKTIVIKYGGAGERDGTHFSGSVAHTTFLALRCARGRWGMFACSRASHDPAPARCSRSDEGRKSQGGRRLGHRTTRHCRYQANSRPRRWARDQQLAR